MRDILLEKEAEAKAIKKALEFWAGMTIKEARKHGWNDVHDNLQARLWVLGYEITDLKNAIKKHLD